MGHITNSTLERRTRLKPGNKPMKRGGRLRPVRKTREGTDARLKQDLTKVLSKYARLRDPICIVCMNADSEHGAHLFHRDMPSVEFDPRNVWGCCADCNFANETNGQPMHDAVLMRIGQRAYDDLCTLAHNHKLKLGRTELEILFSEMTTRIEEQSA